MKSLMLDFATNNRTTDYFRDYAIIQIKFAYALMEYLAPDSIFKPRDLSPVVNSYLAEQDYYSAVIALYDELGFDCYSSQGTHALYDEAVKVCEELTGKDSKTKSYDECHYWNR